MEKKEVFKYLIKEWHESEIPQLNKRMLKIPETNKIVSLIGSRRTGKTFYFYQLIKELRNRIDATQILYINFEDDRILPLEMSDLNTIIEAYFELYPENTEKMIYLFFDEIQNIKNWELFVRRIYDRKKTKIFVTGSSSKLLSKEIATSLRGRTISFYLYPLSFREFLEFKKIELTDDFEYSNARFNIKKQLETYLYDGGFPEVTIETRELKQKILRNYYEMFIYRDLVERYSIRNIALLKKIAMFLITNISSEFSLNSYYKTIKKECPAGKETLFEYLSYLEDINIIHLVPIFSYSLKKQQVNPRKVYCIDTGLRNAVSFVFSKDEGKLAENIVFMELKRREKEPYYWKNKGEVDFVLKNKDNYLTAINVSYTDSLDDRETKALLEFRDEFAPRVKDLLLITKDIEKTENGIKFVPLWKWLCRCSQG
ncbi:MAG: ATP-binding protein [archaeon]|nr:ATP-binding protein [archaeon]